MIVKYVRPVHDEAVDLEVLVLDDAVRPKELVDAKQKTDERFLHGSVRIDDFKVGEFLLKSRLNF